MAVELLVLLAIAVIGVVDDLFVLNAKDWEVQSQHNLRPINPTTVLCIFLDSWEQENYKGDEPDWVEGDRGRDSNSEVETLVFEFIILGFSQALSNGCSRPSFNYSLLEDWLDVGQGGPGDELVELHSHCIHNWFWLLPILSHMAEVLLHHHLAGLPP